MEQNINRKQVEEELQKLQAQRKAISAQLQKLRAERDTMLSQKRAASDEEFFAKAANAANSKAFALEQTKKGNTGDKKATTVDQNKKASSAETVEMKAKPKSEKATPKKANTLKTCFSATPKKATPKKAITPKKLTPEEREGLRNTLDNMVDKRVLLGHHAHEELCKLDKAREELSTAKSQEEICDEKLQHLDVVKAQYGVAIMAEYSSQSKDVVRLNMKLFTKQATMKSVTHLLMAR